MNLTQTTTTTETWSRTHARHVAGKVAADLRQMNQAYGMPDDTHIANLAQELTVLLDGGFVKEVTYGFKRADVWVVAMRYVADMYGNLTSDDRSGSIPRGANVDGATFYSFLTYSAKWTALSAADRAAIEASIMIKRGYGVEPSIQAGVWIQEKTYSAAGCGLRRTSIGGIQ